MAVLFKKVFVTARDSIVNELVKLSEAWVEERCCPGYYKNDLSEFIDRDVYVAVEGDRVVAYALGHVSVQEVETSYNKIEEKAYELDELYVASTHRNRGIGRGIYKFLEDDLSDCVDVIKVIAVSKEYKGLLKFYIDELDLQFNHALLIKRMH